MPDREQPLRAPGAAGSGAESVPSTGRSDKEIHAAKAANRFDIRRLIGALFMLYGLILVALGILGSHHVKSKAAGINVDLFTGIGMLVFGALMIFWALSRPTVPEPEPAETRGEGSGGSAVRRRPEPA